MEGVTKGVKELVAKAITSGLIKVPDSHEEPCASKHIPRHKIALAANSSPSAVLFPGRKTLHPREIARALSVSQQQVQRWAELGLIESIRISCGQGRVHRRVMAEALDQFILQGGTRPKPECPCGNSGD